MLSFTPSNNNEGDSQRKEIKCRRRDNERNPKICGDVKA
jgi:hypothetical protein